MDNEIFNIFAFIILGYAVGWCLSEIGKSFIEVVDKYQTKKYCITIGFIICITCGLLYLALSLRFKNTGTYMIIVLAICYICAILFPILIGYYFFIKQKGRNTMAKYNELLSSKCDCALDKYLNSCCKKVESKNLFKICYALIQTDPRYSRIHNFSAAKSFSKNLSVALAFIFIILNVTAILKFSSLMVHPYLLVGILFGINCFVVFSVFAMILRYKFFEEELNIFAATYFIDYVKRYYKQCD